ncbi:hypothetical protein DFH07DRAFT_731967 [Mycena maculata]|uniref:Uncharacterized protein n=1 Tax=Mycena maculata TaxID=230809 RepID=A0AAD7NUR5_9AGAR|nr:hypothetical protein DFH07DRAFT_731967 [Mycena maculata]
MLTLTIGIKCLVFIPTLRTEHLHSDVHRLRRPFYLCTKRQFPRNLHLHEHGACLPISLPVHLSVPPCPSAYCYRCAVRIPVLLLIPIPNDQPCAFLATDYILLVRLAYTLNEKVRRRCLPIRPRYIVRLFVGSDISTFLLQRWGGGLTAIGGSVGNIGDKISMFGLCLQFVSFAIFTVLLLHFGWRL